MGKGFRTNIQYLEDIQTSMKRIAEYIKGYDFPGFQNDYKTVDAYLRNRVAHEYFEIDYDNLEYSKKLFTS